jgi:L-lactate dehydrogenase (cytochrome)
MRLDNCHNFHDFRALARRRLPGPIFDYIDGAADDEATLRQNAASFERCDLVPNVLRGVGAIDISVTVMGHVWTGAPGDRQKADGGSPSR